MVKDHYRKYGYGHGPGGFNCTCCNKWGKSPRRSKPLERRHVRRKMKKALLDE